MLAGGRRTSCDWRLRVGANQVKLCAQVIEADGEVHPGESMLLRAALERWVLPMEDQECVEPLVYGLDFQVVPRPGISMPG